MAFEDYDLNEETGEITVPFLQGGAFSYDSEIDLKAFLKELHNELSERGFKDHIPGENVEVGYFVKKGEIPDAGELTRTGDMYETKFIWLDKGNGGFDIEVHWKARKTTDMFGDDAHLTFTLNLVNRNMTNKEIVNGNSKQVFQTGKWELRNKIEYKNNAIANKVESFKHIPLLSTKFLIKTYAHIFLHKNIVHDISLTHKKAVEPIENLIKKYFSN